MEERRQREMENESDMSRSSKDMEEKRRLQREQRQIEYTEKELIDTSKYLEMLQKRRSRAETPEVIHLKFSISI